MFLQTFDRSLRSVVLRWVALNPIRINILHHHCVEVLQTRFVLLIQNFTIRRYRVTKFAWVNAVTSSFRTVPARSAVVFVSLQTSHFGSLGKCVTTLCLPVGLLVFGFSDISAIVKKIGRLFYRSHPHINRCFLFWLNHSWFHHDIV